MRKLMVAAVLALVLASARPAPQVVKPDVPWGICEWCWWCLECWILPTAPTSVDYDVQQTFNPF
jgi:hypothetical protein